MLLACLFLYSCTPRIYFTSSWGQNWFPILSIFRIRLPKSETGFSKTGFKFDTILGDGFASEAGINVASNWVNYYAALLPRRWPHIASQSVCLSVCPSVPCLFTLEHRSRVFVNLADVRYLLFCLHFRAAYSTAISAAQACFVSVRILSKIDDYMMS